MALRARRHAIIDNIFAQNAFRDRRRLQQLLRLLVVWISCATNALFAYACILLLLPFGTIQKSLHSFIIVVENPRDAVS